MITGQILIEKLIIYALKNLSLNESDVFYIRNILLKEFKLSAPLKESLSKKEIEYIEALSIPDVLVMEIESYAKNYLQVCDDELSNYSAYIMGLISPLPSNVIKQFKLLREIQNCRQACEFLYNLSIKNNYVKKSNIDKNISWTYINGSNTVDVTINLSKPEKDNKDIAKSFKQNVNNNYPKCLLCAENEGFYGNLVTPPRANLRRVEMNINGEKWFMQYSPYGYINEHCILINSKHTPMKIDGSIAEKLFDFIEYIPDYFIGSNSDLPIVGGSILNHEHFQGGLKIMPAHKSKTLHEFKATAYPDVEVDLTDWYVNNIRLSGYNRITISKLYNEIAEKWFTYSDEKLNINNNQKNRHNSLTVAARYLQDGRYSLDIFFRNNSVSKNNPTGIFHVPENLQNIKKEGIGLMEVLGLFVLPGRLKNELSEVAKAITNNKTGDFSEYDNPQNPLHIHKNIFTSIYDKYGIIDEIEKANAAVREYVDEACTIILKSVSVFKNNEEGNMGIKKFLAEVGIR